MSEVRGSVASTIETSVDFTDEKKTATATADQEAPIVKNEAPKDPIIVDWDSPDDPQNPKNWPEKQKWSMIALISAMSFVVSIAPTIFAPGVPQVLEDFHSTNTSLGSFLVSVFVIGLTFGPLFLTPLGESYGRVPVSHISTVIFLVCTIICAVSVDIPMLAIFRFGTGLSGCVPITLGGGFIADLMPPEKRGLALTLWTIGPLLGPVVAPVMGGYVSMKLGWRWTFWLNAIVQAPFMLFSFFVLRETYGPRLLELKARRLRKETSNPNLRSALDRGETTLQRIKLAVIRPSKILIRSPIALIVSLQLAIAYGYMYIFFTTFTVLFEQQYGFNIGEAGLAYLGLGVGFCVGQVGQGMFLDPYMRKMKAKHGSFKPEYRLPPLLVGNVCLPAGLLWYGWSAQAHTHWIVPIIGTAFVGVGINCAFMPTQTYLVDAFDLYAASAIAACTVVRSFFGALLPLAGPHLYRKLGLGWGNTLLALISVALSPSVYFLMKYGEKVRTDPRFQPNL